MALALPERRDTRVECYAVLDDETYRRKMDNYARRGELSGRAASLARGVRLQVFAHHQRAQGPCLHQGERRWSIRRVELSGRAAGLARGVRLQVFAHHRRAQGPCLHQGERRWSIRRGELSGRAFGLG